MATLWDLMQDCIPNDHARQVNSRYYLDEAMTAPDAPDLVVDLGCGRGASAEMFRRHNAKVRWVGVDIGDSPESKQRVANGDLVVHYDGLHLPFQADSIPLIYSHQVFEHVRRPGELLQEIARTLRPGGQFIGSTSQFEPYHSFSVWNYTPYGFRVLVEEAGLKLEEIRPSIDGIALIMRTFLGRPPDYSKYFVEDSPLNSEIDQWADGKKHRPALTNLRKLTFCGQFAFRVRKPNQGGETKPDSRTVAATPKSGAAAKSQGNSTIAVSYKGKVCKFDAEAVRGLQNPGVIYSALLNGNFYEHAFLTYIHSLNIRGTYVDVGACIGTHTLFFALMCPSTRVHAFEPRQHLLKRVQKNINLNGVQRKVSAHGWALADRDGEVEVELDRDRHLLRTRRMDDLVHGRVDVIKIDVEGMEVPVLEGATRILRRWRPVVFAEAHDEQEYAELVRCLERHGYHPTGRVFNASPTYEFVPDPSGRVDVARLWLIRDLPYRVRKTARRVPGLRTVGRAVRRYTG